MYVRRGECDSSPFSCWLVTLFASWPLLEILLTSLLPLCVPFYVMFVCRFCVPLPRSEEASEYWNGAKILSFFFCQWLVCLLGCHGISLCVISLHHVARN